MKAYNLNPVEREFTWGKQHEAVKQLVTELGEQGRGRHKTVVPIHAKNLVELTLNTSQTGKPVICDIKDGKDNYGLTNWLAKLSGAGCYTRNTLGTVYCLASQEDNVYKIAQGHGAFGDAGRIGTWYEYLCIICPETWIRIRPAGGVEKMPRYWMYFDKDQVYTVPDGELDAFNSSTGIAIPGPEVLKEDELLIDLADIETFVMPPRVNVETK